MARKPNVSVTDDRSKLIEALRFASIATKDEDGKTSFVVIENGHLCAYNDTFTIGVNVDVALELCPHAEQFQAALQQCKSEFVLTQLNQSAVSIKSGAFRALVPALTADLLDPLYPDPPVAVIGETLREAMTACLRVMSKGERLINTCMMLRANTIVATNGGMALEYWHGIDLPGPLNIPKKTAETLSKITKPLSWFGFSEGTVTFYFDDMSFLKSRLINGMYPDVDRLFNAIEGVYVPIWPALFVGLNAIKSFVQDDRIYFHSGYVATHQSLELGASYEVTGLPSRGCFNPSYWKAIEPFIEKVNMGTRLDQPVAFHSVKGRGLLMGKSQ